jgi:hypothetical protein
VAVVGKNGSQYLCFELLELVILRFFVCLNLPLGLVSSFLYTLRAVYNDQPLLSKISWFNIAVTCAYIRELDEVNQRPRVKLHHVNLPFWTIFCASLSAYTILYQHSNPPLFVASSLSHS